MPMSLLEDRFTGANQNRDFCQTSVVYHEKKIVFRSFFIKHNICPVQITEMDKKEFVFVKSCKRSVNFVDIDFQL